MSIVDRVRSLADALPDGATVNLSGATLRAWLAEEGTQSAQPAIVAEACAETWRERLWSCAPETRLGVHELAEALGRSRDWCYRAVSTKQAATRGRDPLPCTRLDGALVFTAGAVRRWLQSSEQLVQPERRALRAVR